MDCGGLTYLCVIGKNRFRRKGRLINRGKRDERGHRVSHINDFVLRFLLAVEKRPRQRMRREKFVDLVF